MGKSEYDSGGHKWGKIQQKFGMTCLRIDDDQGSR
jgi:hypothetical protein